jgi:hypothetical protein
MDAISCPVETVPAENVGRDQRSTDADIIRRGQEAS